MGEIRHMGGAEFELESEEETNAAAKKYEKKPEDAGYDDKPKERYNTPDQKSDSIVT